MVGIVVILLLGSLAWSAVGALFTALGEATAVFAPGRPTPTKLAAVAATPTGAPVPQVVVKPVATVSPQPAATGVPTGEARSASATAAAGLGPTPPATPTDVPAPEPTPAVTPTPAASGRAPWILLPLPAPDAHVAPGPLVVEARARGDSPITAIHLELDGAALPVALEQRAESTWRGSASVQIPAGHHAVRATVVDDQGRSGSFRWNFDASP
jgi:hypothetical protein